MYVWLVLFLSYLEGCMLVGNSSDKLLAIPSYFFDTLWELSWEWTMHHNLPIWVWTFSEWMTRWLCSNTSLLPPLHYIFLHFYLAMWWLNKTTDSIWIGSIREAISTVLDIDVMTDDRIMYSFTLTEHCILEQLFFIKPKIRYLSSHLKNLN